MFKLITNYIYYALFVNEASQEAYPTFEQLGPGARFLKVPVTFRAQNQILKWKYKE